MSTLNVAALQDVDAAGSKATLPITGSNFTLGPGWGVWEFVSNALISSLGDGTPANIDVTSMAVGYDYLVSLRGIVPATDGVTLEAQLSQSGTFLAGSSYNDTSTGAASMTLNGGGISMGNASTEGGSFEVFVPEPNKGSTNKFVRADGLLAYTDGDIYNTSDGGELVANQNACDGLRLSLSGAGDFQATGSVSVFRRRIS